MTNIQDRFWSKVSGDEPLGCWQYQGARSGGGYGVFWARGRSVSAHRFAYESLVADIPEGLHLDHLCRDRACVNPWHMEPVPTGLNVLRGVGPSAQNARKQQCPRGHQYDATNTHISRRGKRTCKSCHRDHTRLYMRRVRSES